MFDGDPRKGPHQNQGIGHIPASEAHQAGDNGGDR